MKVPEPDLTSFDLRGRLIGVPVRIHPFFWSSALLLGTRYIADPEAGSVGYLAFWIMAALVCVLLPVLAQAFVGRCFRLRLGILLYGLGSQATGIESLPRSWQRVSALLAGPVVSSLLVAGIWGAIELIPFPAFLIDWGWQTPIATGAAILVSLNLWWCLLSLLPIWPLAGGQIVVDVGETYLGRTGRNAALILSLISIAILSILVVSETNRHLNFRYDPRYLLHLQEGIVWLAFCFVLWLRSFKLLWEGKPG
jgi:stage IV sporulation protein FB